MTNLNRYTVSFYNDYILSKWYKQYFEIVLKKRSRLHHICRIAIVINTFIAWTYLNICVYLQVGWYMLFFLFGWNNGAFLPFRKNISLSLFPSSSAWSRPNTSFRASGVTEHFNNLCTNSSTSYATFQAHPSTSLKSTCWRGYLCTLAFPESWEIRKAKTDYIQTFEGSLSTGIEWLLKDTCWRGMVKSFPNIQ